MCLLGECGVDGALTIMFKTPYLHATVDVCNISAIILTHRHPNFGAPNKSKPAIQLTNLLPKQIQSKLGPSISLCTIKHFSNSSFSGSLITCMLQGTAASRSFSYKTDHFSGRLKLAMPNNGLDI